MAELERRDSEVQVPGRFDAFYREEYSSVVSLVYGLSGSAWAAEDLAQEAFLRAHNDWARVGQMASPSGWVRRVAMNLAMSRFRRLRSEAAVRMRLVPASSSVEASAADYEAFWDEVRRLPARQAQAVALRYIDELSVAEIGAVLQVAEGTVKALLHQGRTRLARQLAAKGWVDDEV
jgi:RNA polymerase sigma-70 factor (ECF subfamily)